MLLSCKEKDEYYLVSFDKGARIPKDILYVKKVTSDKNRIAVALSHTNKAISQYKTFTLEADNEEMSINFLPFVEYEKIPPVELKPPMPIFRHQAADDDSWEWSGEISFVLDEKKVVFQAEAIVKYKKTQIHKLTIGVKNAGAKYIPEETEGYEVVISLQATDSIGYVWAQPFIITEIIRLTPNGEIVFAHLVGKQGALVKTFSDGKHITAVTKKTSTALSKQYEDGFRLPICFSEKDIPPEFKNEDCEVFSITDLYSAEYFVINLKKEDRKIASEELCAAWDDIDNKCPY